LEDCVAAAYLYSYVIVIAGNHEYYHHRHSKVRRHIRNLCKEIDAKKLVFLDNEVFDISDTICVIGTTLWSTILPDQRQAVGHLVRDYKLIKNWTIEANDNANKKAIKFIRDQLSSKCKKRCVIMTHHAPLMECGNPKFATSPLSSAFHNDLEDLIISNHDRIAVWMYGHDHYNKRFAIGDTTIVSHQLGYPDEHQSCRLCDCFVDV